MFKAMPFGTGQIAPAPMLEDVPARMHPATAVARGSFFERCFRVMTRIFVSPKKPRTTGTGGKHLSALGLAGAADRFFYAS